MRRSWKGSGEGFRFREGMAEAERTVGFALMSSGMVMLSTVVMVGGKLPPPEIFATLWNLNPSFVFDSDIVTPI